MTAGDPIRAAQEVKRTAALLRDARAVLRRLDALAAAARAADDPAHADISALRDGCERLVSQLGHREQTLQRRAREAVAGSADTPSDARTQPVPAGGADL